MVGEVMPTANVIRIMSNLVMLIVTIRMWLEDALCCDFIESEIYGLFK